MATTREEVELLRMLVMNLDKVDAVKGSLVELLERKQSELTDDLRMEGLQNSRPRKVQRIR